MKIGILTLPLHTNYGGNLQAFALQRCLHKLGHDAYLINLNVNKRNYLWHLWMDLKLLFKLASTKKINQFESGTIKAFNKQSEYREISQYTQRFIDKFINPKTYPIGYYETKKLNQLVKDHNFDALVVGSDQVWRPEYTTDISDYFFGFLPENTNVKKFSYAASFGVDELSYTKGQIERCSKLLTFFDAISVREDSAVKICSDIFNANAVHLIDPTMLIDAEDYRQIISDNSELNLSLNSGLITYILDDNPQLTQLVNTVESSLNLNARKVNVYVNDENLPLKDRVAPPVENWLHAFASADFIISDSFHACVFAILFNKPFITIGNFGRGLARFESLLRMFNLQDRLIFNQTEQEIQKLIKKSINWNQVNIKLSSERKKAYDFIMSTLG